MSRARPRARRLAALLLAVAAVVALALTTLGRDGADSDAERKQAAQRYATDVSRISSATGDQLAELSDRSDYRDGRAAANSTRAYAQEIRGAAERLRRITPPTAVRGLHQALTRLYEQTATSLDALATRFAAAGDPVELAQEAQELSTQIQRYSTQEQQLRQAIGGALAQSVPPTSG